MTKPPLHHPNINPNHPLSKGLVGYWPFWEGKGVFMKDLVQQVESFDDFLIDYYGFLDKIKDRMGEDYDKITFKS